MASGGSEDECGISVLLEEVEVLESIYLDDLCVQKNGSGTPEEISLDVHPATADNVDQQYVRATILFRMNSEYPDELPEIVIQNPRGLACEELQRISSSLQDLAEQLKGGPMLYELIELLKEGLTEGNVPHGSCAVCLECFHDDEPYAKTDCYHHFHQACLTRYVKHCDREQKETIAKTSEHLRHPGQITKIVCPVCREPLQNVATYLEVDHQPPPDNFAYTPDTAMRQWQADMAALFRRQKEQGGIINLEEEKNKFLITPGMTSERPVYSPIPQSDDTKTKQSLRPSRFREEGTKSSSRTSSPNTNSVSKTSETGTRDSRDQHSRLSKSNRGQHGIRQGIERTSGSSKEERFSDTRGNRDSNFKGKVGAYPSDSSNPKRPSSSQGRNGNSDGKRDAKSRDSDRQRQSSSRRSQDASYTAQKSASPRHHNRDGTDFKRSPQTRNPELADASRDETSVATACAVDSANKDSVVNVLENGEQTSRGSHRRMNSADGHSSRRPWPGQDGRNKDGVGALALRFVV